MSAAAQHAWWAALPSFQFGNSPALADELLDLILAGVKTATCSALDSATILAPGERYVIKNGAGAPRCVVEVTSIEQKRFDEVDSAFAYDEGEDGRTLAQWRVAHESYFRETGEYAPDMMVLCERFKLVEIIPENAP